MELNLNYKSCSFSCALAYPVFNIVFFHIFFRLPIECSLVLLAYNTSKIRRKGT